MQKPIIDNVYSLDEAQQAITRFGSGSHIGKVVIYIFEGSESAWQRIKYKNLTETASI